jgi:hypothetical protein
MSMKIKQNHRCLHRLHPNKSFPDSGFMNIKTNNKIESSELLHPNHHVCLHSLHPKKSFSD